MSVKRGPFQNVAGVALTKITVPQATVGVRQTVASRWQLPLKRIYLGTVLYAGSEHHTHTHTDSERGDLACCQQEEGPKSNRHVCKCLAQLNLLRAL